MENFSGRYLFTNHRNVGLWTNRIQGEFLCSVVFGMYRGYGTGDFVDFLKWGGCCFLVLRYGELGLQSFAAARGGT